MRSLRNFIPLFFVLYHFIAIAAAALLPSPAGFVFSTPIIAYFSLALYFAGEIAVTKRQLAYFPIFLFLLPAIHYTYGIASLCGYLAQLVLPHEVPEEAKTKVEVAMADKDFAPSSDQEKLFHFSVDVDFVRGSETGLDGIYEFCERYDVKPTLFITGQFAVEYPDYIQEAARRGYQLGTHGWRHGVDPNENFATDSYDQQRMCIARSTEAVENACGVRPRAFRAPNLWVSETTLQVLEDEGYEIDSSVPTHRFDLGYGQVSNPKYFSAPLSPYHPSRHHLADRGDSPIVEMAPSAFFVPMNMSGLRVLKLPSVKWAAKRILARSSMLVFYLHPAEFVPFEKLQYVEKVPRRFAKNIGPQNFEVLGCFVSAMKDFGTRSAYMHESLPDKMRRAA